MGKPKKRIVFGLIIAVLVCMFAGCKPTTPKVADEIWDNENALSVAIAPEYVKKVFNNWESAFADLGLKAVFITNKAFDGAYDVDYDPSLTLLLVLENGGKENQETAVEKLKTDKRVLLASILADVPFESTNTLQFEQTTFRAKVGDTITLTVSGYYSEHEPWFDYNTIYPIVLKNYNKNKTYTPDDFPHSGASKIETTNLSDANYLKLHLSTPSYFNAIKAVHAVAQHPDVLAVSLNNVGYPAVLYADRWIVSDTALAEITNLKANGLDNDGNHLGYYDGDHLEGERMPAKILCNQAGTFTVTYTYSLGWHMGGSVTCTIIVE